MTLWKPSRRALIRFGGAIFAPAIVGRAFAQVPMTGAGVGAPATAPSYTGPGDIASGAAAWWGLRGYNAAYSTGSNPAIDIVDQALANQLTVNILSNGKLDVSSVATWVAAHTVTTIFIKKSYDQTGNGNHIDAPRTAANYPTLVLNDNGSLPAGVTPGFDAVMRSTTNSADTNEPFSASVVAQRNGAITEANDITIVGATPSILGFDVTSGLVRARSGTTATTSAPESTTHSIQALFNAASSIICVDGSNSTVNAGNNSTGVGPYAFPNTYHAIKFWEAGWWLSDISSSFSALNTNQHSAANGWNF
jgi:hypothetical protein